MNTCILTMTAGVFFSLNPGLVQEGLGLDEKEATGPDHRTMGNLS